MSTFTETIKPSVLRRWDSQNQVLKRFAPWSLASRIETTSGQNLEDTIGSVEGVTSSLNVTAEGFALDASAGKVINDKFGGCSLSYDSGDSSFYAQYGDAESTRKKLSGGVSLIYLGTLTTNSTFNLAQLFPDDYQDITVDDVLVVQSENVHAALGWGSGGVADCFGNIYANICTKSILNGVLTIELGLVSGTMQCSNGKSAAVNKSIPCKVYLKAPSAGILSNERNVVWLSNGTKSAGKIFLQQITIPTGGVIYNETDYRIYNGDINLCGWGTTIIPAGTYNFYVQVGTASYVRIFLIY